MAVRSLPQRQRRLATIFGAAGAVALRAGLTMLAARLLTVRYVQLAGGLLILWIALKVLRDASDPPDAAPAPRRIVQAIWYIVAADLTMSVDNILAIAGAAQGHNGLIVFGLCLSIPLVIFAANLLASLMDRYSFLIYIGAAILGEVGGKMIMTDPFTVAWLHPSRWAQYGVEAALAIAVVVAGRMTARARARKSER
jgi:YjbE family integral membrane protein